MHGVVMDGRFYVVSRYGIELQGVFHLGDSTQVHRAMAVRGRVHAMHGHGSMSTLNRYGVPSRGGVVVLHATRRVVAGGEITFTW